MKNELMTLQYRAWYKELPFAGEWAEPSLELDEEYTLFFLESREMKPLIDRQIGLMMNGEVCFGLDGTTFDYQEESFYMYADGIAMRVSEVEVRFELQKYHVQKCEDIGVHVLQYMECMNEAMQIMDSYFNAGKELV